MKQLLRSNWGNFLMVAIGIVFAILLVWPHHEESSLIADVYVDGGLRYSVALDEVSFPYMLYPSSEPRATLRMEEGRIRCYTAERDDIDCVKTGWLTHPGDTAACPPGHTLIVLRGQEERVFGTH